MLLLAAVTTLAMAGSSWAFDVSGVGGRIGVTDPDALDPTPSLGVHAEVEQRGSQLHLMPNLAYWNVDRVSNVNPNFDMYYHFEREHRVSPYLGGGLGLNFRHNDRVDRSQTDLGVNMIGGVSIPDRNAARRYYVEGRYTASDMNQISLLTGITFGTR
jgi:hypothetical protein